MENISNNVYGDYGKNRKMGLRSPQQDDNLIRDYYDERKYL